MRLYLKKLAAVLEKLEKNRAFATFVEAIRDKIAGGGEAVRDKTAEEVEAVREAAGRVEEPGVESPVEAKKGPPGRRRWWNVRGERTQ